VLAITPHNTVRKQATLGLVAHLIRSGSGLRPCGLVLCLSASCVVMTLTFSTRLLHTSCTPASPLLSPPLRPPLSDIPVPLPARPTPKSQLEWIERHRFSCRYVPKFPQPQPSGEHRRHETARNARCGLVDSEVITPLGDSPVLLR
jgi:hypothetical protein